jgi:hypothetical protein
MGDFCLVVGMTDRIGVEVAIDKEVARAEGIGMFLEAAL